MQRGTTTEAEAAVVEIEIEERERKKITLATEGFTPSIRRFESILRDRSELSRENALTISDYIIAMKREINPRLNTIRTTIQFLAELSKTVGIDKKFNDMMATNEDVLLYLDSCRMG